MSGRFISNAATQKQRPMFNGFCDEYSDNVVTDYSCVRNLIVLERGSVVGERGALNVVQTSRSRNRS